MKTAVYLNEPYGEHVRYIRKLRKRERPEEYPEPTKWSVQTIFRTESGWIEICRIDNHLHEGKTGSHLHIHGRVIREDMTYQDAQRRVEEMTREILRQKFDVDIQFDQV